MSTISAISSSLVEKSFPFYALTSTTNTRRRCTSSLFPTNFNTIPLERIAEAQLKDKFVCASAQVMYSDPSDLPAKSPPGVPTAPPRHNPGLPPEVPRRPNVPDFDPIPPEKPADAPPISPGPIPEFPGPPNPSPPKPESPKPPVPSPPGQPEVFPPHGPDVIPPKPPEPGPPHPTQPHIPTPFM